MTSAPRRPSYRNRAPRPGQALLAPIRQLIESVYDILKGQLDLELHGGRSLVGVTLDPVRRVGRKLSRTVTTRLLVTCHMTAR
ncbi:hypothetical protein ACI8AD_16375 [Geodermatophilus sp. SYSU D00766]